MNTSVTTTDPKVSMTSVGITQESGGGMISFSSMAEVIRFADAMARSGIAIPKHLRENPGACMAVTLQAARWFMDPFSVANKSYSVNDRLAYEAQLIAAVVNTRAPIARRPDYSFSGSDNDRRCKVSVEMLDGSVKEYETPPIGRITVKNSPLWKSDPDHQLGYFAIRSWARRYAPEVILGVYDRDELDAERDISKPVKPGPNLVERLQAGKNASVIEHDTVTVEPVVDDPRPDWGEDTVQDDFPGDRA